MDKQKKIIFAVLIIVVISLTIWLSYLHITQKYYEQGFADGKETIYNQINSELDIRGYAIIQNNQSQSIKLGEIDEGLRT